MVDVFFAGVISEDVFSTVWEIRYEEFQELFAQVMVCVSPKFLNFQRLSLNA